MNYDVVDLSVAHTVFASAYLLPNSKAARASGYRFAQVVACDSPAFLRPDGGEAIPAWGGLVLEDFESLYINNPAGGGYLVVAYYHETPAGAPMQPRVSQVLAGDTSAANTTLALQIGDAINAYLVTGIYIGYNQSPSASPTVEIEFWEGVVPRGMYFDFSTTSDFGQYIPFPAPVVVGPNQYCTISVGPGGSGVAGVAVIFGRKLTI